MNTITETIVDKTLSDLGVVELPKQTPVPTYNPVQTSRKTKVLDARDKSWTPKTSRAVSPEDWKKDTVLELLDTIRKDAFESSKGEADAVISQKHMAQIVHLVATDVANGLEHAGLVYMDGEAPAMLRKLLTTFITSQTKHYNGSMYRFVKVVDNG
jgi:hypothetical protein